MLGSSPGSPRPGGCLLSPLVSAGHRSDAIYSALYDGTGHIEVLRGHEYLSHPFAVTLYGGEVYWTDWRTNTLAKANKWTGHNVTVVQRTNTQPFDLQVYHPSRQPLGEAWGRGGSVLGWGGTWWGEGTGAGRVPAATRSIAWEPLPPLWRPLHYGPSPPAKKSPGVMRVVGQSSSMGQAGAGGLQLSGASCVGVPENRDVAES